MASSSSATGATHTPARPLGSPPATQPVPSPSYVRLRDEEGGQQTGMGDRRHSSQEDDEEEEEKKKKKHLQHLQPQADDKSFRGGFLLWHPPTLILLVCTGTLINMEYSILMPTINAYIQSMGCDEAYLGYVIAAFSLSRMLFFWPVGVLTDRRPMREVFLVTCALGVVGNVLYGLAGRLHAPWLLIVARLLNGVGATNAVTTRAYLARVTRARARTMAMAVQNGLQFFGLVIGPALNAGFTHLDLRWGAYVEVNEWTAAGWVMVLPNLLLGIGYLLCFQEPSPPVSNTPVAQQQVEQEEERGTKKTKDDTTMTSSSSSSSSSSTTTYTNGNGNHRGVSKSLRRHVLWTQGGLWCLYTGFTMTFSLSALETSITPITAKAFGWGTMENSYLFAGIAVSAFASVVVTVLLGKAGRADREIIAGGFVCLCGSLLINVIGAGDGVHVALWAVVGASTLLAFSLVTVSSPNSSLYTKMVSDGGEKHQGFFNSLQYLAVATGRCLGPLLAGVALSNPQLSKTYYPFFVVLGLLPLVAVVGLWRLWGVFAQVEAEAARRDEASGGRRGGGSGGGKGEGRRTHKTGDFGASAANAGSALGGEGDEDLYTSLLIDADD